MKCLGTCILVGFVGLAIFGVFWVHGGTQVHDGGCIAAMVQGMDCPKQGSLSDFFAFHLNAFKNFSAVVFGGIPISLLAVYALAVWCMVRLLWRDALQKPDVAHAAKTRLYAHGFLFQQGLIRWLAFHEHSPTLL